MARLPFVCSSDWILSRTLQRLRRTTTLPITILDNFSTAFQVLTLRDWNFAMNLTFFWTLWWTTTSIGPVTPKGWFLPLTDTLRNATRSPGGWRPAVVRTLTRALWLLRPPTVGKHRRSCNGALSTDFLVRWPYPRSWRTELTSAFFAKITYC